MLTSPFLAKVANAGIPPETICIYITAKVIPTPSEKDTVSWQGDTDSSKIPCYRDGRVYLGWLENWQPYATRTEQSSFAFTIASWPDGPYVATPSYTLNWRNLPVDELAKALVPSNSDEEVQQGLDDVWKYDQELRTYNVAGSPRLEYF